MEMRRVSLVPFLARRSFRYGRCTRPHKEAPSVLCRRRGLRFALLVEAVNIKYLVEFVKVDFDSLIIH